MGGYQDVDTDNDTAKLEFAKERLIALLADRVREYAQLQIRKQAQTTIQSTIAAAFEQIAATRPFINVTIENE
jgi:hypothetical protein